MELLLIIVIVIGIGFVIGVAKSNQREEARKRYIESLNILKKNPTNADVKQKTLALGRAYSNLTRDNKGRTTFDEVALMNDINAACAAATAIERARPEVTPSGTIEERLAKLSSFHEADFSRRKKEILDTI
jgi:hypothetical protein